MRPMAIVLVVISLAVAGLAAFLAKQFVDGQKAQPLAAQAVMTDTETVLVAGRDLEPGTVLKDTDLRWQAWPRSMIDPRHVQRGKGDDPLPAYVGSAVARKFLAGEPLTANGVFRQDEAGLLAGMLSPGMRAVTVGVTPSTQTGGFVLPGDRVDVVVAMEVKPESGGGKFQAAEIVVADVRVLAVDASLAAPGGDKGGTMAGKTATLEVTPKQAERVITAGLMGTVYLLPRSRADGEIDEDAAPGFTTSFHVSKVLRTGPMVGLPEEGEGQTLDAVKPRRPGANAPALDVRAPAGNAVGQKSAAGVIVVNRGGARAEHAVTE
ncbi:MAG: Flp pilus assembly protein CpaB [Alphaproteobacteria bacterium]|nr:Flp pilus assembly protein CpaB [Alphaproteobacteria bacterium]